jgi:hypothetical protein
VIVILYPQFHAVGGIARYLDAFLSNLPADAPEVVLVTGDDVGSTKTYRGVRCSGAGAPGAWSPLSTAARASPRCTCTSRR